MSDPNYNCRHCGDPCACRATWDELNTLKKTLIGLKKDADRILGNEDGEWEVVGFMVSLTEKIGALNLSEGDRQ
jgi:hypothetical protein